MEAVDWPETDYTGNGDCPLYRMELKAAGLCRRGRWHGIIYLFIWPGSPPSVLWVLSLPLFRPHTETKASAGISTNHNINTSPKGTSCYCHVNFQIYYLSLSALCYLQLLTFRMYFEDPLLLDLLANAVPTTEIWRAFKDCYIMICYSNVCWNMSLSTTQPLGESFDSGVYLCCIVTF
uniref:Uncharacterized protein n=1 Tax=Salix viminalis TaxID=40686 RepID=A0A6N2N971_SALVM